MLFGLVAGELGGLPFHEGHFDIYKLVENFVCTLYTMFTRSKSKIKKVNSLVTPIFYKEVTYVCQIWAWWSLVVKQAVQRQS